MNNKISHSTFGSFEDLINSKYVCNYKANYKKESLVEIKNYSKKYLNNKIKLKNIHYWIVTIINSISNNYIVHIFNNIIIVKKNYLLKILIKSYRKKINIILNKNIIKKYNYDLEILMKLNNKLNKKNKILKKIVLMLNIRNIN